MRKRFAPAARAATCTVGAMLERSHGLTDAALEAIEDLERRVLMADGGRLKLEWGTLRNRPADRSATCCGGRTVGCSASSGSTASGWPTLELTGWSIRSARRRGIGRALFDAALPIAAGRRRRTLLMVVPRLSDPGGRSCALSLAMTLRSLRARTDGWSAVPTDAARQSISHCARRPPSDIPRLSELYLDGFGDGRCERRQALADERSRTLMIMRRRGGRHRARFTPMTTARRFTGS